MYHTANKTLKCCCKKTLRTGKPFSKTENVQFCDPNCSFCFVSQALFTMTSDSSYVTHELWPHLLSDLEKTNSGRCTCICTLVCFLNSSVLLKASLTYILVSWFKGVSGGTQKAVPPTFSMLLSSLFLFQSFSELFISPWCCRKEVITDAKQKVTHIPPLVFYFFKFSPFCDLPSRSREKEKDAHSHRLNQRNLVHTFKD